MRLVRKELKGAKANKDLGAVWWDIANDYGSIPCQLILFALEWYGIDPKWVELLKSYYGGLWSKCFSPTAPSSWHQHLTGVFQAAQLEFIEVYVLELTSLFFSHSYHSYPFVSWKSILNMHSSFYSFCLWTSYDTLPSPSNQHRWNITTEASCKLCHKQICTTAHVLAACTFALQQGRFAFWHDFVSHVLISVVYRSFLLSYIVSKTNWNTSIKAGSKPKKVDKKESWPVTFHTRLEITVWPQQ